MSDQKQKSQGQATEKQPTLYGKEELIEKARDVFGVQPEVVEGALHNFKESASKEETQNAIDNFLERKVQ